ncbi:MAG: hypothetical protein ACI30H_05820 [Paludibacteraceae bacterium]
MKKSIIGIYGILCLLASCAGKPTDEERAQAFIDSAATLYATGHFEAAKWQLDSIHSNFPQLVHYRRQADTIAWRIELCETDRNLRYVDSLLPIKTDEVNQLTRPFKYEKSTQYQPYGTFTYNILRNEWNLGRSYVKPFTNERGQLFLTAHYCGNPIDYERLRISVGDFFADTQPIAAADKHTYTDLGVTHETALIAPDAIGTWPEFWTAHQDEPVKITFVGNKHNYTYLPSKDERKAFVETYRLATVLADIAHLETLRQHATARQNILNRKLNLKE